MRSNKGFTLVELIICIGIIVVISLTSVVGFNLVSKNIRITKLKDIEDEIMTAAKIYLEINDTAYQQLYSKENAVIVPLNVLVNEGLLDLKTTNLKQSDIEDEYVLTAKTTTQPDSNGCVNITSTASWNLSDENPLYICTKSDGSITLSGNVGISDNLEATKKGIFYPGNDNYAYYNDINKIYRILYIDKDDSIILGNNSSFGEIFNGKTATFLKIKGTGNDSSEFLCDWKRVVPYEYVTYSESKVIEGETPFDVIDTKYFSCDVSVVDDKYANDMYKFQVYFFDVNIYTGSKYVPDSKYSKKQPFSIEDYRKIKLKPCMKITEGNGTQINPYKIEDKCEN